MKKALALATIMLIVGPAVTAWHVEGYSKRGMWPKGPMMEPEVLQGKRLHKMLAKWHEEVKEGPEFEMTRTLKKAIEKLSSDKKKIKEDMKKLHNKKVAAIKEFIKVVESDKSEAINTAKEKIELMQDRRMVRGGMMKRPRRGGPGIISRIRNWFTGRSNCPRCVPRQ